MFILDIAPAKYSDPWKEPLRNRLAALLKGDRRIAYFYEAPDNSTFRYRVYNMIQVLNEADQGVSAAYFSGPEIDSLDKVIDSIDVLVICRTRYSDKLNQLITRAQNKGKTVFFDVDDLVFDPDYIHLLLTTLAQDLRHPSVWDHWYAYVGRMGAALRMCDKVIVTNEYLASRVTHYTNKPVSVIPNFLNKEQMAISQRIFEEKRASHFARNKKIYLGYFSGTPTHNKDFEIVSSALASLLKKDPRVMIRIVGFLDLPAPLRDYQSRIEFYPLHDFVNLQRLVGLVEINLIPLQDNVFTNCKSELKYFEAGIVGTVSIASPTFTLSRAIEDGYNGYIAHAFQWDEKIQLLLSDMESYPVMAERAYLHSEEKYGWKNQAQLLLDTLLGQNDSWQSNRHSRDAAIRVPSDAQSCFPDEGEAESACGRVASIGTLGQRGNR